MSRMKWTSRPGTSPTDGNWWLFVIAVAAVFFVMLQGCASTKPPRIVTRDVPVPVPVQCLPAEVPEPAHPFASLRPGASLWEQVTTLLADRESRKAEIAELRAANSGVQCPK